MVIDQLKMMNLFGFACDVLQEWNNPAGLLSLKVYDWKRSFGISLGKDKATRVQYRESMPTHAMLICGVDLHDNEPTKWKVQNSWVINLVIKATSSWIIHGWINTLITR